MKILFAIDGSECSKEAIDLAIRMKCPAATEFRIVTVVDFYHPITADIEARENELRAANRLIENTRIQLASAHPNVDVSWKVIDGHIVEELLKESSQWPADLIMVGSHGRTGLSEFVLGSVSRALLSNATCAVRVVRKQKNRGKVDDGMKVLLCLDESSHSQHLIDHVLRLPWSLGTKFKLLNVVPEVDKNVLFDPDIEFANTIENKYEAIIENSKLWMKEAAEKINAAFDLDVASYEVLLGDPRKEIMVQIKKWPADIVMLGSHGKRGFEKLFLGSVSEAIATHAPCTVEVTRSPALRKAKVQV